MRRRRYLQLFGAGAIGSLAGCGYRPGSGGVVQSRLEEPIYVAGVIDDVLLERDLYHSRDQDETDTIRGYDIDGKRLWDDKIGGPIEKLMTRDDAFAILFPQQPRREYDRVLDIDVFVGYGTADDGLRWRSRVDENPDSIAPGVREFAPGDDRVYVATNAEENRGPAAEDTENTDDTATDSVPEVALHAYTNSGRAWSVPLSDPNISTVTASDGTVVCSTEGETLCVDRSGARRWQLDRGFENIRIHGTAVYLSGSFETWCVDIETGRKRWTLDFGNGAVQQFAGGLYTFEYPVVRLSQEGEIRWRSRGATSGRADDRGVFVVDRRDHRYSLAELDPANGERRWATYADGECSAIIPTDEELVTVEGGHLTRRSRY